MFVPLKPICGLQLLAVQIDAMQVFPAVQAELVHLCMATLFYQDLLSVLQQADRGKQNNLPFLMFTMCFPASPFEDSTGNICKCFHSILEEAVEPYILETNSADSTSLNLLLTYASSS